MATQPALPLPPGAAVAAPPPQPKGVLRVVTPQEMQQTDVANQATADAQANAEEPIMLELAAHIRARIQDMRNFRNTEGISERMIKALRTYKGQYDTTKLHEIKKFGGSDVYARVTATKCRAAAALLRDIYLGADRPWDIEPTPVPVIPDEINQAIDELVNVEISTLQQSGMSVDPQQIADRVHMLRKAAERASKKQAIEEAERAGAKLDDILIEGNFYEALAEFLIDLPIFPYACIKGPVVRRAKQMKWVNGQPTITYVPKMFWYRVSPFDLYWSPGASMVRHADFAERIRLSRAELFACKGLPGYNDAAIDQILVRFYNTGIHEWWDSIDSERAELEDRERWSRTRHSLLDTAEYTGSVPGSMLREWGMTEQQVPDPLQEYMVTAWLIDRFVIKVQFNPAPDQRAPYFISNFEKIPGSMVGSALPDVLEDVQTVCNATARALVNNLSIASGPQVVINDEVMSPGENDELFPWKRWHVNFDPMSSTANKPIDFFQPTSNATELMGVFKEWSIFADEISSLPRYMTGSEKVGGAGRTSSGLAMLMGNAAKTLQNVAASIDRDVLDPLLTQLFDMVMITMPGHFRGDEQIVVKGVNHAVKREQDRMRQLEFLQLTGNPLDMSIIGPDGRASVLRSVSTNLGLDHERVVPDDDEIRARIAAQQAVQGAMGQQQPAGPNGQQTPKPQADRAPPEQVRKDTGVEDMSTNQATGRPGNR